MVDEGSNFGQRANGGLLVHLASICNAVVGKMLSRHLLVLIKGNYIIKILAKTITRSCPNIQIVSLQSL